MKALVLTLALVFAAGRAGAADALLFATEPYPPFGFKDASGSLHGISVDMVRMLAEDAGVSYRMEMMPWARAIALAETQAATCVFSAALTPERTTKFKWIWPLAISRSILVKARGSAVKATTIAEARTLTVGTHRQDYTEALLRSLHFMRIDISASFEVTLNKLLGGRIDVMPMPEDVFEQLRGSGTEIDRVATLATQNLGIACNLSVPSEMIIRLQAKLERRITDGTQARLYRHYGLEPPK